VQRHAAKGLEDKHVEGSGEQIGLSGHLD
jgi:hypothetical protein